jgi:hypothetical protein
VKSYIEKPTPRLGWLHALLSRLSPQRDLGAGKVKEQGSIVKEPHTCAECSTPISIAGLRTTKAAHNLKVASNHTAARGEQETSDLAATRGADVALQTSELAAARGAQRQVGELALFPPKESWDDWKEWDPKAWPKKVGKNYMLVPTVCFNCEAACGLLAYVDKDTQKIRKFEGNPEHPGSRGRNCAKGPATINQVEDPERILTPLKRRGKRGAGHWQETTWEEVLDTLGARIRKAIQEKRNDQIMYSFKIIMEGIQVPPGEIYFAVEGGNGELGFYLVSDGGGKPYRIRVRPPCFIAMSAFHEMVKGCLGADLVPTFGMINMIGGECDR